MKCDFIPFFLHSVQTHQHGELLRVRRGLLVYLCADPPRAGELPGPGPAAGGGAELGADGVAVHRREEAEERHEGGAPLNPDGVVAGPVGRPVRERPGRAARAVRTGGGGGAGGNLADGPEIRGVFFFSDLEAHIPVLMQFVTMLQYSTSVCMGIS